MNDKKPLICGFCKKPNTEVMFLVAPAVGKRPMICNECVATAAAIILRTIANEGKKIAALKDKEPKA